MTYRRDLLAVASVHHGVVTVRDAEASDVPAVEVRKLAARGALVRIGHGVYRHADLPPDELTEYAEALALAGPDSFLDGDTVLALLGLADANPLRIHVGTTAPRLRRTLPPLIDVRRRRGVTDDALTHYRGLRSLDVAYVLRERLPHLDAERAAATLRRTVGRELITPDRAADLVGRGSRT